MAGTLDPEASLGAKFDQTYRKLIKFLEGTEPAGTPDATNALLGGLQSELEDVTREISALDMFSANETYEEMPPVYLKFLALPYLLGTIWTKKEGTEPRKEYIRVAQTYFVDFLERLLRYGILTVLPPVLALFAAEIEDGSGDGPGPAKLPTLTPEEKRRLKIAKYRESKELEEKVRVLELQQGDGPVDDSTVLELWVTVLKKDGLEAEAQLESILKEKELLRFGEARAGGKLEAEPKGLPNPNAPPFSTFIITKTDVQKKVYGAGYPSLPVMTVEELYQQRRAAGIWPGPGDPASSTANKAPPQGDPDAEREAQEDTDDTELRQRQQAMDEYKDTHRRGWGNRHNRS